MATRTASGFARGMAHDSNIRHENYEFIGNEGPAPVSALSHGSDLRSRDLGPEVHGGHTLGTTLEGCILECTYVRGPISSLITGQGRDFRLGSQRPMAHGKLTQGMASIGHILLGNHEAIRTNGSAPITSFYPI